MASTSSAIAAYPTVTTSAPTTNTTTTRDTTETVGNNCGNSTDQLDVEVDAVITVDTLSVPSRGSSIPTPDSPNHVDRGDVDGNRIHAGPFGDSETSGTPRVTISRTNYQTRRRGTDTPSIAMIRSSSGINLRRRGGGRSKGTSPFCPCFSPTHSTDDEDEIEPEIPSSTSRTQQQRTPHLPTTTPHRNNSSSRLPSLGIAQFARDIRCRLALAADATNNNSGGRTLMANTQQFSQQTNGILMCAQPYPVHTTVEYTHYLIPDLAKIISASYYWGVMDRFEAERLLESKPEGTFLLRDSAQSEYVFSVSFRRYNRILHARIEQAEHRFSFDAFDPQVFSATSVTDLIEHYKDPSRCLFFEPQLTTPLPRTFIVPLQHLCRGVICGSLESYAAIDTLPIPDARFNNYLKEYHYKHKLRQVNNEVTRI